MSLHYVDQPIVEEFAMDEFSEEMFAPVKPQRPAPRRPAPRPSGGRGSGFGTAEMYAAPANKGMYQLLLLIGIIGLAYGASCMYSKK